MFNIESADYNGERAFFGRIWNRCRMIFDVGCSSNSIFARQDVIEVHFFDPISELVSSFAAPEAEGKLVVNRAPEEIKLPDYYNCFGLSDETGSLDFYPQSTSFLDRSLSQKLFPHQRTEDWKPTVIEKKPVRRGDEYMEEHEIEGIDFLKIDVEGFEFNVIKGFGDKIENVKIIQFEYGGCWIDSGIKLQDVIWYLEEKGFKGFSYLHPHGGFPIEGVAGRLPDGLDHAYIHDGYHYDMCNIVCYNSKAFSEFGFPEWFLARV